MECSNNENYSLCLATSGPLLQRWLETQVRLSQSRYFILRTYNFEPRGREKGSLEDWIISMIILCKAACGWQLLRPVILLWSQNFLNINHSPLPGGQRFTTVSFQYFVYCIWVNRKELLWEYNKNSRLLELKVISIISFKFAIKGNWGIVSIVLGPNLWKTWVYLCMWASLVAQW